MLEWLKDHSTYIIIGALALIILTGSITLYLKYVEVTETVTALQILINKFREDQSLKTLEELQKVVDRLKKQTEDLQNAVGIRYEGEDLASSEPNNILDLEIRINQVEMEVDTLKETVETLNTVVFDGTAADQVLTMNSDSDSSSANSVFETILFHADLFISYSTLSLMLILGISLLSLILTSFRRIVKRNIR